MAKTIGDYGGYGYKSPSSVRVNIDPHPAIRFPPPKTFFTPKTRLDTSQIRDWRGPLAPRPAPDVRRPARSPRF
jgi:hypothetical protein